MMYIVRFIGILLGFISFGLGGLLLCHICYTCMMILVRDKERQRYYFRHLTGLAFRAFVSLLLFFRVIKIDQADITLLKELARELSSLKRGVLIVANHPSLIDYVIICAYMPQCCCMVSSSVLKNFFYGRMIKCAGYIANDLPEDKLFAACALRFERGESILIFPEGTRTPLDGTLRLKRGAAHIAMRCHTSMRVIRIQQAPRFLSKDNPWYYVPPQSSHYRFSLVANLNYQDYLTEHLADCPPNCDCPLVLSADGHISATHASTDKVSAADTKSAESTAAAAGNYAKLKEDVMNDQLDEVLPHAVRKLTRDLTALLGA